MPDVLIAQDEETDAGNFRAYLRAQSDADLLDISRHLDPERYPARADAARRETERRCVLPIFADTPCEAGLRRVSVAALLLAVLTLTLALLLTPEEARGPSWPTPEMLPEGIPVSEIAHLFGVALLRGIVVWSIDFGLFFGLSAATAWGIFARRNVRRGMRRLSGFAFLALLLSAIAAAFSSVRLLF